jgi:hypothetical protein
MRIACGSAKGIGFIDIALAFIEFGSIIAYAYLVSPNILEVMLFGKTH